MDNSPTDWSLDGRLIAFDARGPRPDHKTEIWLLSVTERKARPFLRGEFDFFGGRISPDGRWLAFVSDEAGRQEVFVTSPPGAGEKVASLRRRRDPASLAARFRWALLRRRRRQVDVGLTFFSRAN